MFTLCSAQMCKKNVRWGTEVKNCLSFHGLPLPTTVQKRKSTAEREKSNFLTRFQIIRNPDPSFWNSTKFPLFDANLRGAPEIVPLPYLKFCPNRLDT